MSRSAGFIIVRYFEFKNFKIVDLADLLLIFVAYNEQPLSLDEGMPINTTENTAVVLTVEAAE